MPTTTDPTIPTTIRCWCGMNTRAGKLHYPAGDPENGPAHVPHPEHPEDRAPASAPDGKPSGPVESQGRVVYVLPGVYGGTYCEAFGPIKEARARAAYIARCLRSHEALVDAAEAAIQQLMFNGMRVVSGVEQEPRKLVATMHEAAKALGAALAIARGDDAKGCA